MSIERKGKRVPVYGYVRAQAGKNLKKQIAALAELAARENIVADTGDAAGFASLKEKLRAGDLLVVGSLDQLGCSYESILREWEQIPRGSVRTSRC